MKFLSQPICLALCILLAVAAFTYTHSIAQEALPDPPAQAEAAQVEKKQDSPTDNATLNLHRWGAVTLFNGLPSERVNAIAEDARGVLWFATDNGLVRYDGRNVEAAPGETALPSRRVLALLIGARGDLWIGTDAGAARLHDGRMDLLPETNGRAVTGFAVSPRNEVAVVTATGEIIHYLDVEAPQEAARDESSSRSAAILHTFTLGPNSHPAQLKTPNQTSNPVGEALPLNAVTFTAQNDWAVGSNGRGLLLNAGNEVREATSRPPRPYFIASLYDDGAQLWIAERASKQAGGLWRWRANALSRTSLNAGPITAVTGGAGELWAGSSRQGVFLLTAEAAEANDIKVVEHLTFENTAGGLRSNTINAIYRDREGIVWFGTDRGVCRYDRTSFRASQLSGNAQSNFVRTLLRTTSGEDWCGTNRGLFKLNAVASATGTTGTTGLDAWTEISEVQGRSIYALSEDATGAIWAGTSAGLFVKKPTGPGFTRVGAPPETTVTIEDEAATGPPATTPTQKADPAMPNASSVTPAAPDNPQSATRNPSSRESARALANFRGHVYAAFFGRGIERFAAPSDLKAGGDGAEKRALVLNDAFARQAICLVAEREKQLWIGTTEGELWSYDGTQKQKLILPFKPSGERAVRALAFDTSGKMWIGTSQGLFVREGAGNNLREAVSGIDVRALLVRGEDLWIATQNTGLLKQRLDQQVTAHFDTEQGLASQQVFALAAGDNAEVLIGTSRGVVRHRPSDARPYVALKRLVANQIYPADALAAELPLPHTQRNFLLEVAGLGSRTFPSQFQYEFTLTNGRTQQTRTITTHDAQFAAEALTPAPYELAVRAISRDLVYSEPVKIRLRIYGAPFPWPTVFLGALLTVAVAAAAWMFRQGRRLTRANTTLAETNSELRETRLRLANETEAERSRIARDLHDQTLADLRHLLVLTDQLPQANAPTATEDAQPTPAGLRREIEAISTEIRQICEDLSPSALENIGFLPALEWALDNAVAHLPAEQKFAYRFDCQPGLEDRLRLSHSEQIQLYRIVQEAISNICRHARARNVAMNVRAEGEDLLLAITDDGVGFDGGQPNKTGHGVANIRSRANLIGASVEWRDHAPQGSGCYFEVRKDGGVAA